jgi:hypothetical protein
MPEIIVRDGDAYVHMGSLEDAGQKPLNKWLLKPTTDAYIRGLASYLQISISYRGYGKPRPAIVQYSQGENYAYAGCWAHPLLAARYARYCSESLGILVEALCESKRKS